MPPEVLFVLLEHLSREKDHEISGSFSVDVFFFHSREMCCSTDMHDIRSDNENEKAQKGNGVRVLGDDSSEVLHPV